MSTPPEFQSRLFESTLNYQACVERIEELKETIPLEGEHKAKISMLDERGFVIDLPGRMASCTVTVQGRFLPSRSDQLLIATRAAVDPFFKAFTFVLFTAIPTFLGSMFYGHGPN